MDASPKGANRMDPKALLETLVALAVTPVVSLAMVAAVVAGILVVAKKVYRQ